MMKHQSKPISSGPGSMSPFQSMLPVPSPRCHLPTAPVVYLAVCNTAGTVGRPGWMINDASPGNTPVPFLRHGYSPVSKPYRLGVHVEEVACASVNRQPCVASLSTFGVFTFVAP